MLIEEIDKANAEVEIINSIKKRYPKLRQESKAPTFALTYQAVPQTLMKNCGFSEEKAKQIFDRFHELYKVSDEWVNNKLKEAEKNGYLTVAFGLRIRTNKIHQSIMGIRQTPREAEEERRTAANALGQSYCLLNNRAGIEFNDRVRKSEYKYAIRPVAHIHDAEYFLVKDDIDVILYSNKYLIQAVSWQEDPEIWHPNVHLGGEFSIFYPDWAHEFGVPNKVSEPELIAMTKQYIEELTHGNNK